MTNSYEKEIKVAQAAVFLATELARKMQGSLEALDVVNKEDLSPVTITDFSVQALINIHLAEAFPGDEIMGEEDSLYLREKDHLTVKEKVIAQLESFFPNIKERAILDAIDRGGSQGGPNKRFWVLDPIDGTRGFIHQEQYAIALALIENGEVVLAVLGCPRFPLKEWDQGGVFSAIKGKGCFLIPYEDKNKSIQVHVDQSESLETFIYCEPHQTSKTHSHIKAFEIAALLKASPKPFRLDSQVKYAHVAYGDAQIYLRIPLQKEFEEKIWDHAAGALVVEEAGGKVTDLHGLPLNFSLGKTLRENNGVLATNGLLHEKVLEAIAIKRSNDEK